MDPSFIKDLLEKVSKGEISAQKAYESLKDLPFEYMEAACIDHHRGLRRGLNEVIFGQGKEIRDILRIVERMMKKGENILITKIEPQKAAEVLRHFPKAEYHERARIVKIINRHIEEHGIGYILVICAGTSDIPVAEEAAITASFMGNRVETIFDIGVAGIHRLYHHKDLIVNASVLVVVAGMEGALPSVVAGLVSRPVIAVPTSVGYGASFRGISALLSMLNSCVPGVVVVNIDNGFSAGYAASIINSSNRGA